MAALGDIDRFGNQVNWVLQDIEVPASPAPVSRAADQDHDDHDHHGATEPGPSGETYLPGPLSLDAIIRAAEDEGMRPGFAVTFPEDDTADDGATVFGSYAAANPWPGRTQDTRTAYFDQSTGETLGSQEIYGFDTVWQAADYSISTHMGTQFGLVNRIVVTFGSNVDARARRVCPVAPTTCASPAG